MTIASEISRLQTDKAAICTAIENKGVTVGNVTLDDYACCIDAIQQGGGGQSVDVLVVGGGGGGGDKGGTTFSGHSYAGGGGGAGGVVRCNKYDISNGDEIAVVIGCGGAGGCNGGDTIFGTITACGGGAGGNMAGCQNGKNGGSGGGGGMDSCSTIGKGGTGVTGGNGGTIFCCLSKTGGGGGGAMGQGYDVFYCCCACNADSLILGYGGKGYVTDISGTTQCYAGGGGGGSVCSSGGCGCDGGGNGGYASTCATNATTCGSGGGGGSGTESYRTGGTGGNGVVILRYPTSDCITTYGGNKYTCGDYTIHCFTSGGVFAIGHCNITTPGIYHNPSSCLISMSCDGINWLTLKDRNLYASSTDIACSCSYGCMYQWGNNSGFSPTVSTLSCRTTTKVDTTGYGPGNYYSRSCFVYTSNNEDWSNPSNDNLWGGTTNTYEARKGPVASGYHVPSKADFSCMVKIMRCVKGGDLTIDEVQQYLFMPLTGYRGYSGGSLYCQGTQFSLWSSDIVSTTYCAGAIYTSLNVNATNYYNRRGTGLPIRPFKNTASQPTTSGWIPLILKQ